jgi:hypothetical protein
MKALVTLFLLGLIVVGMIVVAQGVGVDLVGAVSKAASATPGCYEMLNAAGQVVQTVCQ